MLGESALQLWTCNEPGIVHYVGACNLGTPPQKKRPSQPLSQPLPPPPFKGAYSLQFVWGVTVRQN